MARSRAGSFIFIPPRCSHSVQPRHLIAAALLQHGHQQVDTVVIRTGAVRLGIPKLVSVTRACTSKRMGLVPSKEQDTTAPEASSAGRPAYIRRDSPPPPALFLHLKYTYLIGRAKPVLHTPQMRRRILSPVK